MTSTSLPLPFPINESNNGKATLPDLFTRIHGWSVSKQPRLHHQTSNVRLLEGVHRLRIELPIVYRHIRVNRRRHFDAHKTVAATSVRQQVFMMLVPMNEA